MRFIDQLHPHDPENGVWGDCFRACIASLMSMDAKDVPHFVHDGCTNEVSMQRLNEWLRPRGLFYLEVTELTPEEFELRGIGDAYHVIIGPSPRFPELAHCIVGRRGKFWFDPHPERAGVGKGEVVFGFIIKTFAMGIAACAENAQ